MNIVMPMAGLGSRYAQGGYSIPKPFINIKEKPMVEWAIKSLNLDGKYIFIVRKEHLQEYDAETILRRVVPDCKIIPIDYTTEGQASSILLAEPWIDNSNPMISVNCDQVVDWNSSEFLRACYTWHKSYGTVDGIIPTFECPELSKKWSYAQIDEHGYVTDVVEKNPITTHATSGLYYWTRGHQFVTYAKQMMAQDFRVNNEFYACPVYKEAIKDGLKFRIFDSKVYMIGTPEELNVFLEILDKRNQ